VSYLSEVLADAPLHYWRLLDPDGSLVKDVGSTPQDLLPTHSLVNSGNALEHYSGPVSDGAAALFLAVPYMCNNQPILAPPFTFEWWVYSINHVDTQGSQIVISSNANGAGTVLFQATDQAGGTFLQAQVGSDSVSYAAASAHHWHHAVLVYTGAAITLYVDAVQQATLAVVTAHSILGSSIAVGGLAPNGSEGAFRFLSEVAVYGIALSPARITAHFLAADNTASSPVRAQTAVSDSTLISQILNAVRRIVSVPGQV
jgi:Concanavalin A-like lectin/glucanases superfamily